MTGTRMTRIIIILLCLLAFSLPGQAALKLILNSPPKITVQTSVLETANGLLKVTSNGGLTCVGFSTPPVDPDDVSLAIQIDNGSQIAEIKNDLNMPLGFTIELENEDTVVTVNTVNGNESCSVEDIFFEDGFEDTVGQ